jgi:PilZ domain
MSAADTTPSPDERRVSPRHRPAVGTTCRFDPAGGGTAHADGLVWNISRTGVSMLLATKPTAGEILTGELTAEHDPAELPVMLRVVHVKQVPTGDYLIGAEFFRPLAPAELARFTAPGLD